MVTESGVLWMSSDARRRRYKGSRSTYGAPLVGLGKSVVEVAWYQSASVMTVVAR